MRLRIALLTVFASCMASAQVWIVPHNEHGAEVHSNAPNRWSLSGATLKRAIAEIFEVSPVRVDLPASLDNDKVYDFTVEFPAEGGRMMRVLQEAVERQFGISITRENRLTDVYVLTAPNGAAKLVASPPSESHNARVVNGNLTTHAMSMPMLAQFLESPLVLSRAVLDETRLTGQYDINGNMIRGGAIPTLQEFGLSVTPDRRTIEIIVVRLTQ
jgi:uncharacterized protein (TIGR03435 family)